MKKSQSHYDYIPKLVIASLVFVLLGIGCFYVAAIGVFAEVWNNILCSIGSIVIVSGIYTVIYEYSIRNSMYYIMRKELGIKDFVDSSGVDNILLRIDNINYKALFDGVQSEIDILHSYSNSWNKANFDNIKDLLRQKKNVSIRVVLLSPESQLLPGLYRLYRKESLDSLYYAMHQSVSDWLELKKLAENNSNKITIYYHKQIPTHSVYRFDDIIVTVSNPIPADNSLKYPTIICRRNKKYSEDLYVNYKNELENVISLSTEVTDNNLIAFWGKIQRTRN